LVRVNFARMSSAPRWLFFRLAVLDLGQPARAVAVLIARVRQPG
jgi:hypothetical protein